MPRALTSPDRLFDRTWRPGHPFRPKLSRWRRVLMGLALLLLCSVIGAYWYVTDSNRVRGMAQDYLSRLIGGNVTIGDATLSIFQGLRLNDVRVYADDSRDEDALLFKAQAFLVRVNGQALINGRVEASQIVAVDPYVRMTEDLDTGKWTHQKLRRRPLPKSSSDRPLQLPQVVLRNAVVEYGQLRGGKRTTSGTVGIEGQLEPTIESEKYRFRLQSRGSSQGVGPSVEGEISMGSGVVSAKMLNFRFGTDLEAMLPAQVRQWWKDHQFAGRLDVDLTVYPPPPGNEALRPFCAEIDLRGGGMSGSPGEWLGEEEVIRSQWLRSAVDAMRLAGLDSTGFASEFQRTVEPAPITLQQVTGKFIFTEKLLEVQNVSGYLESNGLKINGSIENYTSPSQATVNIRVSSLESDDILIPASPRYINSLPGPMREIYDHLRPQGHCRFWVQLNREAKGRPVVEGEIDVLSGSFVFDKFAFPIEGATGKLLFGTNPESGREMLRIVDIRGHGPAGGANAEARVRINGLVTPFGADTGVKVTVVGDDVVSEPTLFNAFPRETQQALKMFDAPGKGQYPKFRGGFTCEIERPQGLNQRWNILTRIRLDDAEGVMVAFPYPMSGVTGELLVTDEYVKIEHATMKRGDATLQIDGTVSWGDPNKSRRVAPPAVQDARADAAGAAADRMQPPVIVVEPADDGPRLRPELRIVATNVPIDSDLLGALPSTHREWLDKLGVAGKFDLDGTIGAAKRKGDDLDFDFRIKLKEGSAWPIEGTFAASDLAGTMRLTPGKVVFESMTAKRGESTLSASGSVGWGTGTPEIAISAEAKNLELDAALYGALPATAKGAWDQVKPVGTLDAALTYSGKLDATQSPATQPASPTTQPAAEPNVAEPNVAGFQLVLTPRKLSVTPTAVPYRLDDLAGTVTVTPRRVELRDMTAKHGDASVKLAATGTSDASGTNGEDAPMTWDFKLSADRVVLDDEFSRAIPKAMADLIKSLKFTGRIGFDFERLKLTPRPRTAEASRTAEAPTTKPGDDSPLDVDFAVKLRADDASLDVGMPISDVKNGVAEFTGVTKNGTLQQLEGTVDFPTLTLSGRPASNLRAQIIKPAGQNLLRIPKLEARIADGELAGQFDCVLGDTGPSRYAVALVLRNADVKAMTGDTTPDLRAQISASLAMEGSFNDPTSRRGRGDVSVRGDQLYRIPLLLGLLQVTNLSLPITSPFNEGASRYSVDGNRVTFESIELRAKEMLMQGNGHLDFGTKQVRLTFVTENTTWPKVPIIGDILQGARHELLKIYVKGTLEEPKVSAGAFSTVTTTVDEVLRGDGR